MTLPDIDDRQLRRYANGLDGAASWTVRPGYRKDPPAKLIPLHDGREIDWRAVIQWSVIAWVLLYFGFHILHDIAIPSMDAYFRHVANL